MLDREAILPLLLGVVFSLLLHIALPAAYLAWPENLLADSESSEDEPEQPEEASEPDPEPTWEPLAEPMPFAPPDDPAADAMADLEAVSMRVRQPAYAGQATPVAIELANRGPGRASPFTVAVLVSGRPVARHEFDSGLGPGRGGELTLPIVVKEPGHHEIAVVIDPEDAVAEHDERNNRLSEIVEFLPTDTQTPIGQLEPSREVTIDWVSHQAFEALKARRIFTSLQPALQREVDPQPVQTTPLDPSETASRRQSGQPGDTGREREPERPEPIDSETAGEPGGPRPSPRSQVEAERQAPSEIALPEQADRPTTPRRADEPELLRLEAVDDGERPSPITALESDSDSPALEAPPIQNRAPRVDRTNPPVSLEADGSQTVTLPTLPDLPSSETARRLGPRATNENQIDPPDASSEILLAEVVAESVDDLPAAPGENAESPASAGTPGRAPEAESTEPSEQRTEPRRQADQPAEQAEDAPERTGQARSAAGTPTAAQQAESEVQPVARIESATLQPGKVETVQGVKIHTALWRPSTVARMTSVPRNPVFNIVFDPSGQVVEVEMIRSTTYSNVDAPLRASLYRWKAEGPIDPEEGLTLKQVRIVLGPDRGDETDDANTEPEPEAESE